MLQNLIKNNALVIIIWLTAFTASGQELDSLAIIERSKDLFKKVHVDLTFKDPYSYELLKIEASPVSLKEKLEFDISVLKRVRNSYEVDSTYTYSDISEAKSKLEKQQKILKKGEKLKAKNPEKYFEKYSSNIRLYEDALKDVESLRSMITDSDKQISIKGDILRNGGLELNNTEQWRISLDCYGANSYGNKVLGQYIFKVSTSGALIGEFIKTN